MSCSGSIPIRHLRTQIRRFCTIVGGVLSPLLANIYLHRFDQWVEHELLPAYTRATRRQSYPRYQTLGSWIGKARLTGNRERLKELLKQRRKLPSLNPNDPSYRRLRYVRYADDVRHFTHR